MDIQDKNEIQIKIETTNDAFESDNYELARILREMADKLENSKFKAGDSFTMRDINGNTVAKITAS